MAYFFGPPCICCDSDPAWPPRPYLSLYRNVESRTGAGVKSGPRGKLQARRLVTSATYYTVFLVSELSINQRDSDDLVLLFSNVVGFINKNTLIDFNFKYPDRFPVPVSSAL